MADDVAVSGYEMHIGPDNRRGHASPADTARRWPDGRRDLCRWPIAGTYLHGFFAGDAQRAAWLARLGAPASPLAYEELVEQTLDALAAHLEAHLDVEKLLSLAR